MLDIAVIIQMADHYGGSQRVLYECLAHWQQRHHLVLYAAAIDRSVLVEHGVDLERVRLVELSPHATGPHADLLNGILLPKIWEREIGVHDVYHAHQWPMHLIDKHPMVWYPHEPRSRLRATRYTWAPPHALAQDLARNFRSLARSAARSVESDVSHATLQCLRLFDQLGRPDRVVANSRFTARDLEATYGGKVNDVVYPGVRLEDFADEPPGDDMVLYVGRFNMLKRLRLVLEAVAQVPGVRLCAAGPEHPNSDREHFARMAHNLGIADRVSLHVNASNLEIRDLYRRCLAVVFPAWREPFGIVALEAMAASRPLIAVDGSGFTEVIDQACAILVPPSPAAIAEKIRFLRSQPETARQMGRAGRAKAAQFSWDRTADELLDIIEEVHRVAVKPPTAAAGMSVAPAQPLRGIHYLCDFGHGFGNGRWQKPITDLPALGYYASYAGVVIEEHLRVLEGLGMDFVVLHLHLKADGIDGYELAALEHVYAVAESAGSPLKFAVQIDLGPGTREDQVAVLRLVHSAFASKPGYLRRAGRPLLFLARHADPLDEPVRRCLMDFALVHDVEENQADGHGPRSLTVSPGPSPPTSRRLAVYRERLEELLGLEEMPEMIVIDSFNDFRRGTHVEESRENGTEFLDLTRRFFRQRLPCRQ